MVVGYEMRFPIAEGFPVITERDISGSPFNQAIGEIAGFINGARTQTELEQYGCRWWNRWVTKEKCEIFGLPEGDLGDGSYGAAFHNYPDPTSGEPFNQFEHLLKQMQQMPHVRTHLVDPWIPPYALQHKDRKRKVVVAPCHGWLQFFLFPDTKEMVLSHVQRSGDMPVGVPFNIIQYAALGMVVAQILGYTFTELVHYVRDAHIYEEQIPQVEAMLAREPRPFPTVTLNPSISDLFAFRPEHFTLTDYHPHEKLKITTPV